MITLTQQQKDIIEAIKRNEKIIKINAFAGTGKTTTLLEIAKKFYYKRMLYLAFNKSIQLEAKEKFPKNTEVKTTHALAFYYVVIKENYNKNIKGNYKPIELAEIFNIDVETAKLALVLFENYCNSASRSIVIRDEENMKIQQAKEVAQKFFNLMEKKEIDITHSFYLKKFQLGLLDKTILPKKYDIALLDEAQDTNDVTLSIFYNLPAEQKVIVGDKHQQIYSFRGSVNAIKKVRASIYHLTQSFRFGDDIANNATTFLRFFKKEKRRLRGTKIIKDNKKTTTKAYISRTNSKLIEKVAELAEEKLFFKTIREPYLIFGLALNILNLEKQEEVDNSYKYLFYYYNDYKENSNGLNLLNFLKNKAIEVDDMELYTASKIVSLYDEEIKKFYEIAKTNFNEQKNCNIFLTTAHSAKGLEWDEVEIMDDFDLIKNVGKFLIEIGYDGEEEFEGMDYLEEFSSIVNRSKEIKQEIIDEFNLYYVAITRAKSKIIDNSEMYDKIVKKDRDAINKEIRTFLRTYNEKINKIDSL